MEQQSRYNPVTTPSAADPNFPATPLQSRYNPVTTPQKLTTVLHFWAIRLAFNVLSVTPPRHQQVPFGQTVDDSIALLGHPNPKLTTVLNFWAIRAES